MNICSFIDDTNHNDTLSFAYRCRRFFASVEQAADPRLRGLPIAVGGRQRGVITSASYEARVCGIKSAMPTQRALQLCPDLIVMPGNFELYERFSDDIFGLCRDLTPDVEQTSVDEGFLDFSARGHLEGVIQTARSLDREILRWLRITVSEGIASNRTVAAVASKWSKPRGFVVVPNGSEGFFLGPLPMRMLPGVGAKTEGILAAVGIRSIADLVRFGPDGLRPLLGRMTESFLDLARGIDPRPLICEKRSSVSASRQHTYAVDEGNMDRVVDDMKVLIDSVVERLRRQSRQARTMTLRIRYTDMEEISADKSLPEPSDLEGDFYPVIRPLLGSMWRRRVHLRLIAVRFSNIYPAFEQLDLFVEKRRRDRDLARTIDSINTTVAEGVVFRACHLQNRLHAKPA